MAGEFAIERVESSDTLPSVRFHFAHELAHLVFFQAKGGTWDSDVFREHERALERACSRLARTILLPRDLFVSEVGDGLFNAMHLRRILSVFRFHRRF